MQSRNAHSSGREGTISFDLIPLDLQEAMKAGAGTATSGNRRTRWMQSMFVSVEVALATVARE